MYGLTRFAVAPFFYLPALSRHSVGVQPYWRRNVRLKKASVLNPQQKAISLTVMSVSSSNCRQCCSRTSLMYRLTHWPVCWRKKRLNASGDSPCMEASWASRNSSL